PEKNILFVVLTSDRGLCGAFNTNINKATEREWRARTGNEDAKVTFATIGKKGREYLARRGATIVHDFAKVYDGLDMDKARLIAGWLAPRFKREDFDAIYIVYNEFKSAITQRTAVEPLLPLAEPEPVDEKKGAAAPTEFLFEPNREALLERLVPMY